MRTSVALKPGCGARRGRLGRERICAPALDVAVRASGSNAGHSNPNHPQHQRRSEATSQQQNVPVLSSSDRLSTPASSSSGGGGTGGICSVTFWLHYEAEYGQRICVVGNTATLGAWQHRAAPELTWGEGHNWSATVEVPRGEVVEYKYVVLQADGLRPLHWQHGNNAVLALLPDEERVDVYDNWYDASSSSVVPEDGLKTTRSDRLALWSTQLSGTVSKLRNELRMARMEAHEAHEETRSALQLVKSTQQSMEGQLEDSQKLARELVEVKEDNNRLGLQLLESQTLFQEVMAEAREIIMASIESNQDDDDEDDDDDEQYERYERSNQDRESYSAPSASHSSVDTAGAAQAKRSSQSEAARSSMDGARPSGGSRFDVPEAVDHSSSGGRRSDDRTDNDDQQRGSVDEAAEPAKEIERSGGNVIEQWVSAWRSRTSGDDAESSDDEEQSSISSRETTAEQGDWDADARTKQPVSSMRSNSSGAQRAPEPSAGSSKAAANAANAAETTKAAVATVLGSQSANAGRGHGSARQPLNHVHSHNVPGSARHNNGASQSSWDDDSSEDLAAVREQAQGLLMILDQLETDVSDTQGNIETQVNSMTYRSRQAPR